ncbi:MAG: heavy metal sensor histidine kinase, partial [Acidobacteria bacterium]|nr:heavy metal sensor histidine kinase [Acidobacteriota bacterium]
IFSTIIVLMTLVMTILFAGFAVLHLTTAAKTQRRDHEQYVTTTMHFINSELEKHLQAGEVESVGFAEIDEVVRRENASRHFGRLIVVVADERGKVLLATDRARELLAANPPYPQFSGSSGPAKIVYWSSPAKVHYVLSRFEVRGSAGQVRLLRIALDWSDTQRRVASIRRQSLAAVLSGTILAAIAAALVTRHALRPLSMFRDATESIRSGSFDTRFDREHLPVELVTLADSMRGMQAQLKESFERLSQFAAELAHELRTPVNNLMGEAEVVLARPRSSEEYQDALASNLEEMARLSRMIDRLLFLAHASRGSASVAMEPLDLAIEVDRVIEYHQAEADDAGVKISRTGGGEISGDRTLFRRALSNLLSNAVSASTHGGRIGVSIRATNATTIVDVTDEGIGIADDELPRVFERFYRSQAARQRRPEGSGLGLAVVKSIVELHGGTVSVASHVGKGTTMTMTFPSIG